MLWKRRLVPISMPPELELPVVPGMERGHCVLVLVMNYKAYLTSESGSGGAASWRVSDAQMASGTYVHTLSEIVGEN
jgi:hypothetical protein